MKKLLLFSFLLISISCIAQPTVVNNLQIKKTASMGGVTVSSFSNDTAMIDQSQVSIPTEYAVVTYLKNHPGNGTGGAINDGLKSTGGISLAGNVVTITGPTTWSYSSANYSYAGDISFTIVAADSNTYRRDLIYADIAGNINITGGAEDSLIAIAPPLPPNSVMVAIVDVAGSQIEPPLPVVIGVTPTLQQTLLQGNVTTEPLIIKFGGQQAPFQISRSTNGPIYSYTKNLNSGIYAGAGALYKNNVQSFPGQEHSGHFLQVYMGSTNNALVPDGGLVRSNAPGGLTFASDSGEIKFMQGFPYSISPWLQMGAFKKGDLFLNKYKNNLAGDSVLSTDTSGKVIMKFVAVGSSVEKFGIEDSSSVQDRVMNMGGNYFAIIGSNLMGLQANKIIAVADTIQLIGPTAPGSVLTDVNGDGIATWQPPSGGETGITDSSIIYARKGIAIDTIIVPGFQALVLDSAYVDSTVRAIAGAAGAGVQSVSGSYVDNTDPLNPIVNNPNFNLQNITDAGNLTTNYIFVLNDYASINSYNSAGTIGVTMGYNNSKSKANVEFASPSGDIYLQGSNGSGLAKNIELPNISGTLAEGITNGTTTIHAGSNGIVDISSLLSGGGSSTDTTSLSNRINLKANITPSLTIAQRDALVSPTVGKQIFQTDDGWYEYYDSFWGWMPVSITNEWMSKYGVTWYDPLTSTTNQFVARTGGTAAGLNFGGFSSSAKLGFTGAALQTTGTTTTGYSSLHTQAAGSIGAYYLGSGKLRLTFFLSLDQLSDATNEFIWLGGFALSPNLATYAETSGAFFSYDRTGAGNGTSAQTTFQCVTRNSGTSTVSNSGVTVAYNTRYKFTILIDDALSTVTFKINDVVVATNTTNLPGNNDAIRIHTGIFKTAGTTSVGAKVWDVLFKEKFTTAR